MAIAEKGIRQEVKGTLDVAWVRSQFPSLKRIVNGHPAVYLDGPGGTQVPQSVIDAISGYLTTCNANGGGLFPTSRETDALIKGAREAMADFLHCRPEEVVFGQNMTSLTEALSRSIGRDLSPGDEIVLTRLDHDANFSPWKDLEEHGVKIQVVDIDESDCTLDMADLARKIGPRTKLVAVGYASNAVGTINDVASAVKLAHQSGALAFVDAVHYAPHGPIDVKALDCDFLACSTYKFFGPHMGVLFGKSEHLKRLRPYKVRPNTEAIPERWEWGTLNHECIAGITACVDYLAELGRRAGSTSADRRTAILQAFVAIQNYEKDLLETLMSELQRLPGIRIYGITDPARFDDRCPTLAIRSEKVPPRQLASQLGERGFFTWNGNFYAINLTERLGIEADGGLLRIGLAHYNTEEEIARLIDALKEILR
jgi:cysteine desulfurase family protein (TIGR01976 family)